MGCYQTKGRAGGEREEEAGPKLKKKRGEWGRREERDATATAFPSLSLLVKIFSV